MPANGDGHATTVPPSDSGHDLPPTVTDLEHPERRQIQTEVILGGHRDLAGRADEVASTLERITDAGRLGIFRAPDRLDHQMQRIMRITAEGGYRLARDGLIPLLVSLRHRALRIVFRQQVGDQQSGTRQANAFDSLLAGQLDKASEATPCDWYNGRSIASWA